MTHLAEQIGNLVVGEEENAAIDFTKTLDAAELLTGTPVVSEISTNDLTISNESVSVESLIILGRKVAIGKAVQFHVIGVLAGVVYFLSIKVTTNSTPVRTLIRKIRIVGEAV